MKIITEKNKLGQAEKQDRLPLDSKMKILMQLDIWIQSLGLQ